MKVEGPEEDQGIVYQIRRVVWMAYAMSERPTNLNVPAGGPFVCAMMCYVNVPYSGPSKKQSACPS